MVQFSLFTVPCALCLVPCACNSRGSTWVCLGRPFVEGWEQRHEDIKEITGRVRSPTPTQLAVASMHMPPRMPPRAPAP